MTLTAIHLLIHGRVQGVGYRSWVRGRAVSHGLTGWVRNCVDGTVETVLCGDADAVAAMQKECRQGPLAARVSTIDASPWNGEIPADFRQVPTA